jgi:UDP-N-acetylglucosamine 2-epimerase
MHRTQIALCYGTRPQVIKASVLRSRLEARYSVVAVDTGQHYDYELDALLQCLLTALASLDRPVLLALHPRTRAALDAAVGYLESLTLARAAEMVFTDSGGLQREAYWMGTPCVTLRRETEWIETVEEGANIPIDPTGGAPELARAIGAHRLRWSNGRTWPRTAYGAGDAAERVVSALAPLVR